MKIHLNGTPLRGHRVRLCDVARNEDTLQWLAESVGADLWIVHPEEAEDALIGPDEWVALAEQEGIELDDVIVWGDDKAETEWKETDDDYTVSTTRAMAQPSDANDRRYEITVLIGPCPSSEAEDLAEDILAFASSCAPTGAAVSLRVAPR